MDQPREKEQLLALKVMRLTKPSLATNIPIYSESRDIAGELFDKASETDLTVVPGIEHFALSELLTLPQNFGNIFLGEMFSSYISVHNDSSQECKDIVVKADLQTSSQRLTLSTGGTDTAKELGPDQSIDDIIHHEVKELGTHILVCAVSYTTVQGEKMYFRKFFKFQVLKPLDVKTKFYTSESDDVYLEAQIQNITPGPIYMEKVALEPSSFFTAAELNTPKNTSCLNKLSMSYLNAMDTHQYLYCLTPKPDVLANNKQLKGVTNIGKLDIVWRMNIGEKGRLQTSALQRMAPGYGDVRVTVDSIPDIVEIEKPFNVTFKVANCCERMMDLVLDLKNSNKHALYWCGISGRQLGKLGPGENIQLNLTMLATTTGLQTINGLWLTDSFLKRTYEHDDLAQIFVYYEGVE
ncbi:unnamed protein product [Owenia fusiformis]|uniref:Uncharacterized protein n=1 Tax=Owenia fusiformis TaxID=6347 RepID=A0A8J1US04_OWEFU|nr:unnamed protein product [Owenia fusiformis]